MAVFRFMPIPHHQRERELRQLDDTRTQQLEELLPCHCDSQTPRGVRGLLALRQSGSGERGGKSLGHPLSWVACETGG